MPKAQPNKKVVQAVQGNKLTIKDLRTRKKYWNKPYGYYTECPNCQWKIVDGGYWKVDKNITNVADIRAGKNKKWHYYQGEECARCGTTLINKENEENYFDLVCYTGWKHWNRTYKFLPCLDLYNKIKKEVNEELDEFKAGYRSAVVKKHESPTAEFDAMNRYQNDAGKSKKFKGSTFRIMPYFIFSDSNNTLTIITQNTRQLDFARNDIAFFWRGNKWRDKNKTIKDNRRMLWCTGFNYVNNKINLVVLTLELCYFWQYFGNVVESRGQAIIYTSQLGNAHEEIKERNKETGEIIKSESFHQEDYAEQNEKYCRACDNCFDFCGDLRNKACKYVGQGGYSGAGKASWQPHFAVGMATSAPAFGAVAIGDTNPPLMVPNAISLVHNDKGSRQISSFFTTKNEQKPILFFLLDEHHFKTPWGRQIEGAGFVGGKGWAPNASPIYRPYDSNGKRPSNRADSFYWDELPQEYADQPHLLNHSSAQVYFTRKLLFTANWKHLLVRRKKGGKGGKRGISAQGLMWVLGYRIIINSSIAGILYNFESGDIFFKWELKVKGSYQSVNFIDAMVEGLFKMLGMGDNSGWLGKISGVDETAGESGSGEGGSWFNPLRGITNFLRLAKEAIKGWVKKQIGQDFNQIFTTDKFKEFSGIKDDLTNDDKQATSEAQTERMKKSTAKAQNRIVEPAIFYTNTIDLSYDFFEFGNRAMADPFEIRAETSKLLHDNLVNNNNKNPIQQFNIRFSAFKQCITEGEWQGEVNLFDFDTSDGWWKRTAGAGTFFYKDLKEFFPAWQPIFRVIQSLTRGQTGIGTGGGGQDEVEIIKKGGDIDIDVERDKGSDFHQRAHYFIEYEDGSEEHWMCLMPIHSKFSGGYKSALKEGHNYGGFILEFARPVKAFYDVYTCIGCGATSNNLFVPLHSAYNNSSADDLNYLHKGLPVHPWKSPMTSAHGSYSVSIGGKSGSLGSRGDVWEGAYISAQGQPFTRAYGRIPGRKGKIVWKLTSEGEDEMKWTFKDERVEFEKEEEYKAEEYAEPNVTPVETELDVEVDIDNDEDKEDMDADLEEFGDRDAGEVDDDDDWDNDLDSDHDQDEDSDFDLESDEDDDSDSDSDDDSDTDEDTDSDHDQDEDTTDDDDDDNDNG